MNKKNKADLFDYRVAFNMVCNLRTFPNRRNLKMFESTALNQIGKCLEQINWVFRDIVNDNKKPRKALDIIRNCRIGLEDLRRLTKRREMSIEKDMEVIKEILSTIRGHKAMGAKGVIGDEQALKSALKCMDMAKKIHCQADETVYDKGWHEGRKYGKEEIEKGLPSEKEILSIIENDIEIWGEGGCDSEGCAQVLHKRIRSKL